MDRLGGSRDTARGFDGRSILAASHARKVLEPETSSRRTRWGMILIRRERQA